MSEETGSGADKKDTPKKTTTRRPAAKKTASSARKTVAKPATKKTPAKKAPARKSAATKSSSAKTSATKKTAAAKSASTAKTKTVTAKAAPKQQTEAAEPPAGQNEDTTGDTKMNSEAETAKNHSSTSQIVEDLKGRDWPQIIKRALLMFFFGVLGSMALYVAFFLATAQVVFTIFAGETNPSLTRLIKQLGNYIHDVLHYLSFATEECPFPFGRGWPDAD